MKTPNWTEAEKQRLRELLLEGLSDRSIAAIMGRTEGSVYHGRKSLGPEFDRARICLRKPIPDNLAEFLATNSFRAASAHFKLDTGTISRMARTLGIEPRSRSVIAKDLQSDARRKLAKSPKGVFRLGRAAAVIKADGDGSLAGSAATFLRRTHANVFRAAVLSKSEIGNLPDGGRNHYFVSGRGFMTSGDLIDLAEAKGFGGVGA